MWRLKLGVQRFCAAAPMGHQMYRVLQSVIGGLPSQKPRVYVAACSEIVAVLGDVDSLAGRQTVEIGTGWRMSLPLALHLLGSGRCVTFDVTQHCRAREVMRSARALLPPLRDAFSHDQGTVASIDHRWSRLEGLGWSDFLEAAGITYRAPANAANTGLDPASRDLVFSRATLQHIPPDMLTRIFVEARRVLRAGGLMWHRLGLTDQLSLFDRGLPRIHYLSYSEEHWERLAGNRYAYSNRWRISDYVRLAEEAGFEVEVRNARVDPESIAFVRAGGVHPDFAGRDEQDLATVAADLVCRKP